MACSLASLYHKNFIDHQSPSWHCDAAFILFFIFFLKQLQIILPALIAQHGTRFFSRTGHFRGCWRSFSPLGKQSTLRTDSFSAPAPTITPAPTTEDFHPPPRSVCLFSHLLSLLSFSVQHRPPPRRRKRRRKNHQLSAHSTTLSLCIQDPVGPFPLSNTPGLPSFFFLFVCFTVIILLAQKRVGVLAVVQKNERQREREVTWELS